MLASIESAMKSLYRDGRSVRRKSWEQGCEVRFPDFKLNPPVLVESNKMERLFVPTIHDILVMDWQYADGGLIENVDMKNGMYRAFMYALESSNPISILDWYPGTKVYLDAGFIKIDFLSSGVKQSGNYIAQRNDYLSDRWVPYKEVENNDV